jgi:hypothetical protein
MLPVAFSEGVTIHCPRDGRFSFFNSPFPAHQLFTAIDIYPNREFGGIAPSPIRGRVVYIRRVKCPETSRFQGSCFDYVILLQSLDNPERIAKILHVVPSIECGEVVEVGQDLGRLLRSGFFNFWTDPHLHVEVRPPSDPLRARGGFKLRMLMDIDGADPLEELRGTVTMVKPEYTLISLEKGSDHGVTVDVGGETGILDGGVPHYGWVGVHMMEEPTNSDVVNLCGKPIASIRANSGDMYLAKCGDIRVHVNGINVGLSLYLFPAASQVKLIPLEPGALKLEKYEEISVDIA